MAEEHDPEKLLNQYITIVRDVQYSRIVACEYDVCLSFQVSIREVDIWHSGEYSRSGYHGYIRL